MHLTCVCPTGAEDKRPPIHGHQTLGMELPQAGAVRNVRSCTGSCIGSWTGSFLLFHYYDGEHSYKNQLDNLIIANNFLNVGSVILVDDYNEIEVENATLDFVSKYSSNFRILKEIKTANKYIHPTYANGIILIEKV